MDTKDLIGLCFCVFMFVLLVAGINHTCTEKEKEYWKVLQRACTYDHCEPLYHYEVRQGR